MKLVFAAGIFAGAIMFALVQLDVLGGDGGGEAVLGNVTPTALGEAATQIPVATGAPPSATEVPPIGTPITSPVDVPIMMYHIIGAPDTPDNEGLSVTVEDFARQMAYLDCAGFTPITVQRLFDAFEGTAALPEKPIILTFDDGWDTQYANAYPVLKEHGFAGSFAIVTGFVDGGGPYMTWAQIEEMASSGMEMLSHTVSHPDLGNADDETVIDQMTTSKADLEAHVDQEIRYLVYPAGEPFRSGTDIREIEIVQMAQNAGYVGGLLADGVYGGQNPATPFELSRVRVFNAEDVYSYAGSIYGEDPDTIGC